MMSVSLDGFFEGPERELDWQFVGEELHAHFNEWLGAAGAFLKGRITYELMASFWPTVGADPSSPRYVREFAEIWRTMPKIVYSRTLDHADWNATVVSEVVQEQVRALLEQPGGDLVLGGANLAATFRRLDLIDEYRFYVQPVLLGTGHRLFAGPGPMSALRLAETRAFGSGVVLLRYER
jgi:dihydrofolate reductase